MYISHKNIDIIFRDNNCLDEFRWHNENATLNETLEKALKTFSIMTTLWLPECWFVEFSNFNFGIPQGELKKFTISSSLSNPDFDQATLRILEEVKNSSQSIPQVSLKLIQTSLRGWNRIIIPKFAKISNNWQILNTDNRLWSSYSQYPAPSFNGLESIWMKMNEMNSATHFSLVIEATGDIILQTSLGITFFNPENDIRDAEEVISNVKLKEWQKVNQQLYHNVLDYLQDFGWERLVR